MNHKQKEDLIKSDLIYIDYNYAVSVVEKWCNSHGDQKALDFFRLGINFALCNASAKYVQHGIELSEGEARSLNKTDRIIKKYDMPELFDSINEDHVFLPEFEIWNR